MARSRSHSVAYQETPPTAVVVPDFSGLIVSGLLNRAADDGLVVSITDAPAAIDVLRTSARWIVAGQHPPAGVERYRGDHVVVDLRRDDGLAGDREPRTPPPARARGRGEGTPGAPDTAVGQSQAHLEPDPR